MVLTDAAGPDKYATRAPRVAFKPPGWVEDYDPRPIVTKTGAPAPGTYCLRLVKGGPAVAARIWVEEERDPETGELLSDQRLFCEIDGIGVTECTTEDPKGWPYWPITPDQHAFMVADAAHCRVYEPENPKANPRRPIDKAAAPVF